MHKNEYWSKFKPLDNLWNYFALVLYVIIGGVGLTLNTMILYYLTNVKKKGRPGDIFIVNLVVSDIGKILSNIPMAIVSCLLGKWVFGQIGCDIYGFGAGICGFSSIITVVVMSIERYIVIKNPVLAIKISKNVIFGCICGCWVYAIAITLPELTLKNRFVLEGIALGCTFDYLSRDIYTRSYMMIMFIGGFILPILIISIFYYLLYLMIRRNSTLSYTSKEKRIINKLRQLPKPKNTKIKQAPDSPNIICELESNFEDKHDYAENESSNIYDSRDLMEKYKFIKTIVKAEVKIVKFTSVILVIFFISWFPYACVALIGQFGTNIERFLTPTTAFLPFIFAKISSALNPLFFILTNSRCRNYYVELFKRKYKKKEKKKIMILKEAAINKKSRNR